MSGEIALEFQPSQAREIDDREENKRTIAQLIKEIGELRQQLPAPVPVPTTVTPAPVIPAPPPGRRIQNGSLAVFIKRLVVVILVLAIAIPFIVPRVGGLIVDYWIKPSYFNITDTSSAAQSERVAYDFVSRHGKVPASVFVSRIHGVHKNPKLFQIQSPDDTLQVFDRNQSMIKAMLEILRTSSARSVSSFHVVNDVDSFDSLPDLLIMDNKYVVPEKWYQYLLSWMMVEQMKNTSENIEPSVKKQMTDWALWVAGIFGWKHAETRHLDRFTFLFNPKIIGTGSSSTTLDQKISLYGATSGNRFARKNFYNTIFVDGIVPLVSDSPPGFKLEKCKSIVYMGQQAWDIQGHIETTKVLLNVTSN